MDLPLYLNGVSGEGFRPHNITTHAWQQKQSLHASIDVHREYTLGVLSALLQDLSAGAQGSVESVSKGAEQRMLDQDRR